MDENIFVSEFEWAVSNIETAYPFIKPVRVPGTSLYFSSVIADASITVPSLTGFIRLVSLSGTGAGAKVVLADDDVSVTFEDAVSENYGEWRVLSWVSVRGSVRMTLALSRLNEFAWPVMPKDSVFVPDVIHPASLGVTGVVVHGQRLEGDVTVELGYNMEATYASAGNDQRPGTAITLIAESGTGLGLEPCTDPCPPVITTINNISPNGEGNFNLEGEDCYSVLPALLDTVTGDYLPMPAMVTITNSCSPCCDCDDYGVVYTELMTPMMNKGHILAERYRELVEQYTELINRIRVLAACKSRPEIKLVVTPGHNHSAHVAVGFFNNSESAWPSYPQAVRIGFDSFDSTPVRVVDNAVKLTTSRGDKEVGYSVGEAYVEVILHPIPCCTTQWVSFNLVWDGAGRQIQYKVHTIGALDDFVYNLEQIGMTLAPVNRSW